MPEGSGCDCDDGKPADLLFAYTGESCDASTNDQGGAFDCEGDPAFAQPVSLEFPDGNATAAPGLVNLGEVVTVSSLGSHFGSNTEFEIVGGGDVLQTMNIHTSCSKELNFGDQFGSLMLVGMIPENGIESCGAPLVQECSIDVTLGAQGPEGPQGPQGKLGPQGDQGKLGAQGDQGKLGMQGEQGKLGMQGEQGKLGMQGPQGKPGMQGDQGKIGPIGPQGDTGLQGVHERIAARTASMCPPR